MHPASCGQVPEESRVLPPAFKAKTEMLVILPSNYSQVFLNALRQQTMSRTWLSPFLMSGSVAVSGSAINHRLSTELPPSPLLLPSDSPSPQELGTGKEVQRGCCEFLWLKQALGFIQDNSYHPTSNVLCGSVLLMRSC